MSNLSGCWELAMRLSSSGVGMNAASNSWSRSAHAFGRSHSNGWCIHRAGDPAFRRAFVTASAERTLSIRVEGRGGFVTAPRIRCRTCGAARRGRRARPGDTRAVRRESRVWREYDEPSQLRQLPVFPQCPNGRESVVQEIRPITWTRAPHMRHPRGWTRAASSARDNSGLAPTSLACQPGCVQVACVSGSSQFTSHIRCSAEGASLPEKRSLRWYVSSTLRSGSRLPDPPTWRDRNYRQLAPRMHSVATICVGVVSAASASVLRGTPSSAQDLGRVMSPHSTEPMTQISRARHTARS